jgi:hypothetical protein
LPKYEIGDRVKITSDADLGGYQKLAGQSGVIQWLDIKTTNKRKQAAGQNEQFYKVQFDNIDWNSLISESWLDPK